MSHDSLAREQRETTLQIRVLYAKSEATLDENYADERYAKGSKAVADLKDGTTLKAPVRDETVAETLTMGEATGKWADMEDEPTTAETVQAAEAAAAHAAHEPAGDVADVQSECTEDDTLPTLRRASEIRQGSLLMIKGRPCQCVEMSTLKSRKRRNARVHIVATDLLTGTKMEEWYPTSHQFAVPAQRTERLLAAAAGLLRRAFQHAE